MPSFENIFPSTVMLDSLERQFTKKEQLFFNKCSKELINNVGNKTSKNNYVLDSKELKELKNILTIKVNEYLKIITSPKTDCELYITQSWINYTEKNGHHHKHYHPNSYLSGIIYLNADKLQDKIYFVRPGRDFFNIQTENYNLSNSETWFFTTGTKDIVIFPSKLEHYVEVAPSEETRISLSFNTFFKGSIGIDHSLTELKL
jgi:uncharacterized protein (TIGR02466 family)